VREAGIGGGKDPFERLFTVLWGEVLKRGKKKAKTEGGIKNWGEADFKEEVTTKAAAGQFGGRRAVWRQSRADFGFEKKKFRPEAAHRIG